MNKLICFFRLILTGACLVASSFAFSQTISLDKLNCPHADEKEIQSQLRQLLNWQESHALNTLQRFYPEFKKSDLNDLSIRVVDFGENKKYRGFYSHSHGKSQIFLDCARGSQLSWPSLLAHEISHHLSEKKNLAHWMNEALAQIIEVHANPYFNFPRLDVLKKQPLVPSFFSPASSFDSSEVYAVNQLFALYISHNFRGFRVFQNLNSDIQTLADFSKKLIQYTKGQSQFDWIRDYLSERDLIRYFALALNINQTTQNGNTLYQVPGWQGFSAESLISKSGKYFIEPGGFIRLSKVFDENIPLSKQYFIYRILKNKTAFKIQNLDESIQGEWTENFLVLINPSLNDYLELSL